MRGTQYTMAALVRLGFLVLTNLVLYMSATVESLSHSEPNPNPEEFVKSSCRATRYPLVCVESLLPYAAVIRRSERQLAMTALSVSISSTRSSAAFVKNMSMSTERGIKLKPREWRALQDCMENMGDSVDRLGQSVRELGRTGREDFAWHMSNVQTWVSAALTDDNTCLDGFASSSTNGNLKALIKNRVLRVAQVTSNALALVNRFASRHGHATRSF